LTSHHNFSFYPFSLLTVLSFLSCFVSLRSSFFLLISLLFFPICLSCPCLVLYQRVENRIRYLHFHQDWPYHELKYDSQSLLNINCPTEQRLAVVRWSILNSLLFIAYSVIGQKSILSHNYQNIVSCDIIQTYSIITYEQPLVFWGGWQGKCAAATLWVRTG